MRFTSLQVAFSAFSAFLATTASAATHIVEVGQGGLRFTPDTITAVVGDTVEFHFDGMHSVIAGDFASPCTPVSSGGFYSGVMQPNGQFSITVTTTDPIFFYCGVDSHCEGGMSGVINQGSNTLADYKSASGNVANSVSPAAPFGGTSGSGGSSSVSSATVSATTATSQASTTESATTTTSRPSTTETSTTTTSEASATGSATTRATSQASATGTATTATSQPPATRTATRATSEASATKPATTTATASASKSPPTIPTTLVAAAGHLTGPIAKITCLVLVLGGILAL